MGSHLWTCCRCSCGPQVKAIHPACSDCGVGRCDRCTIDVRPTSHQTNTTITPQVIPAESQDSPRIAKPAPAYEDIPPACTDHSTSLVSFGPAIECQASSGEKPFKRTTKYRHEGHHGKRQKSSSHVQQVHLQSENSLHEELETEDFSFDDFINYGNGDETAGFLGSIEGFEGGNENIGASPSASRPASSSIRNPWNAGRMSQHQRAKSLPQTKKVVRTEESARPDDRRLACLFAKKNPAKHADCLKAAYSTFSRLKSDHLNKRHSKYATCWTDLPNQSHESSRSAHCSQDQDVIKWRLAYAIRFKVKDHRKIPSPFHHAVSQPRRDRYVQWFDQNAHVYRTLLQSPDVAIRNFVHAVTRTAFDGMDLDHLAVPVPQVAHENMSVVQIEPSTCWDGTAWSFGSLGTENQISGSFGNDFNSVPEAISVPFRENSSTVQSSCSPQYNSSFETYGPVSTPSWSSHRDSMFGTFLLQMPSNVAPRTLSSSAILQSSPIESITLNSVPMVTSSPNVPPTNSYITPSVSGIGGDFADPTQPPTFDNPIAEDFTRLWYWDDSELDQLKSA